MNIGFDFDGVIVNCGKLKSYAAKKLYGIDIPIAKFRKEIVVGENYLTIEQYHELQKMIYETREFGLFMEPVDGVFHFLPRIIADGHTIRVITSRTYGDIPKEWLFYQGFQLNFINVGPNCSKADAANGLDLYVDDDLDKLKPLIGIVPHLYLFSWDYNISLDTGKAIKRIASWEELYYTIQKTRAAWF